MFRKLNAINRPETANVHCLYFESVTSHGKDVSVEATDAPSPASTSNEGRAQHSRVPTEVNNEKELSSVEDALLFAIGFTLFFLRDRQIPNCIGHLALWGFIECAFYQHHLVRHRIDVGRLRGVRNQAHQVI